MNQPVLYCFSATGNSRRAAQIIADKMGAVIYRITTQTPLECHSDTVGFIFPTFYFGAPGLVKQLIASIDIKSPQAYIFAVTTCGKISGNSIGQIKEILEQRNRILQFGGVVYSVANYICEYNIAVDKIDRTTIQAQQQAEFIADELLKRNTTSVRKWPAASKLFHCLYTSKYPRQDQHFHIEPSCTGCGLCSKVCPANNIKLEKGRPEFLGNCENCLGCVHWCAAQAIQWKNVTRNRARYHHPQITLKEIIGEK